MGVRPEHTHIWMAVVLSDTSERRTMISPAGLMGPELGPAWLLPAPPTPVDGRWRVMAEEGGVGSSSGLWMP